MPHEPLNKVSKARSALLKVQGKMEKLQSTRSSGRRRRRSWKKPRPRCASATDRSRVRRRPGRELLETARLAEESAAAKKKVQEEKVENSKTLRKVADHALAESDRITSMQLQRRWSH